ncbi:hypothetical protein BpHYR1_042146 [Brachionus plicatilis]|uniref:Uncharacterized protein n=1 Tax=Brachionus plicatilis TaxID=10195 RepID=A0A3M7QUQ6_BRAPC|nr:hypothetical protein BpHYR1_042146 [Brachionus plicatilis]
MKTSGTFLGLTGIQSHQGSFSHSISVLNFGQALLDTRIETGSSYLVSKNNLKNRFITCHKNIRWPNWTNMRKFEFSSPDSSQDFESPI